MKTKPKAQRAANADSLTFAGIEIRKLPKELRACLERAGELGIAFPASLTPSRLNGFQIDSFLQQVADAEWDRAETMADCAKGERGTALEKVYINDCANSLGYSFVVEHVRQKLSALDAALAACRSIRFASNNAVRHGGEYSLNDLLAADRPAKQALEMTPELIDRAARGLLAKYKKGGAW